MDFLQRLRRLDPIQVHYQELQEHEEHHPEIQRDLERILGRRMVMSASTSYLGYGLQAVLLHGIVPVPILLIWVAVLVAIEASNGTLAFFIARPSTSDRNRKRLIHALRAGLLCCGSVWGAVVLLPNVSDHPTTLLMHCMGLGVASVLSVYNLSNDRLSLAAFNLGLGGPLVYGWLILGRMPFELGIATVALWVLCQIYATSNRRMMRGILLSNFVSRRFAAQLAESNATLKILSDQLKEAASTDPLTGCFNRRALLGEMDKELARAHRNGSTFCIIILDLDHFKSVNDQHGHNAGDAVLKAVALLLKNSIRSTDFVGRWGGEEFVCLLANTDLPHGALKAQDIRALIEQSAIDIGQGTLHVTASIGAACYTPGSSLEQLIEAADRKLYDAKESGRNKVCW